MQTGNEPDLGNRTCWWPLKITSERSYMIAAAMLVLAPIVLGALIQSDGPWLGLLVADAVTGIAAAITPREQREDIRSGWHTALDKVRDASGTGVVLACAFMLKAVAIRTNSWVKPTPDSPGWPVWAMLVSDAFLSVLLCLPVGVGAWTSRLVLLVAAAFLAGFLLAEQLLRGPLEYTAVGGRQALVARVVGSLVYRPLRRTVLTMASLLLLEAAALGVGLDLGSVQPVLRDRPELAPLLVTWGTSFAVGYTSWLVLLVAWIRTDIMLASIGTSSPRRGDRATERLRPWPRASSAHVLRAVAATASPWTTTDVVRRALIKNCALQWRSTTLSDLSHLVEQGPLIRDDTYGEPRYRFLSAAEQRRYEPPVRKHRKSGGDGSVDGPTSQTVADPRTEE